MTENTEPARTFDMEDFAPDKLTDASIVTAKGITIKLGDVVQTAGSTVVRVVTGISPRKSRSVHAERIDGGDAVKYRWMDPNKLTVTGTVL